MMCLIMTIIAAVVFTALWAKMRKQSLLTTTLMFWGASLMWSVDGIASLLDGEPFFDISSEDTVLGFIIVACGLAIFAVLAALEKRGRELKTN